MARAVDRLQELKSYDCNTIVDPCPMDLGRDVEFVAEVAQKSGVNIVCAAGVYNESEGIPYTFRSMPREDILELYVKEITEGVGSTGGNYCWALPSGYSPALLHRSGSPRPSAESGMLKAGA